MKYQAVIFDLFGTLIFDIVGPPAEAARAEMADSISIPLEEFNKMWAESYIGRNTGAFASNADNIANVCQQLGVKPLESDIGTAAKIRQDYSRKVMMDPRAGALETLPRLREAGLKTGLISNCDPDPEVIWPDTPFASLFDAAVFSPSAGCMKPDHQIYRKAADLLGVPLSECVYVANGHRGELRGAFEAGMFPVLILPAKHEESFIISPPEEERALAREKGRVIHNLSEIPDLLNEI